MILEPSSSLAAALAAQLELPQRVGPRPRTTNRAPHTQLDQTAPEHLQDRVRDYALALPGVRAGDSQRSVPGAVGFFLDSPFGEPLLARGPFHGEWGHLHPKEDGSLHLNLPTVVAETVLAKGWGEYHYLVKAGLVPPVVIMAYGPRDDAELDSVLRIIEVSYVSAGGRS